MKKISFALVGAFFIAGLAILAPAMAETPDGTTPANEGVCDVLKTNATPGLYGLCVAYCEAQDLDTFEKEPVNSKILANYNKKKQASDPDMPCVKIPCPCWSDAELASITADNMAAACMRATNRIQIIDNAPRTHFAESDTTVSRERCRYIDLNVAPTVIRSFNITAPEAAACYAAVSSACSAVGL
ncbi:hypothetical protein SCL_1571 [Sulfuricaulis limicola]|uniref:Uncharacterized protein n=1 Tax=Sulfuricaulis limicola TaxID=1620215 RepID=A0A1B4XGD8_9GAMM|nr:hypothetical protein [Sulfuricaulis limicola]BAV33876.1 hypothetical protein SCL_1571 [Sulfuricaulis limicola]